MPPAQDGNNFPEICLFSEKCIPADNKFLLNCSQDKSTPQSGKDFQPMAAIAQQAALSKGGVPCHHRLTPATSGKTVPAPSPGPAGSQQSPFCRTAGCAGVAQQHLQHELAGAAFPGDDQPPPEVTRLWQSWMS